MKNTIKSFFSLGLLMLLFVALTTDGNQDYSQHNYVYATSFGFSNKNTGAENRDALLEAFDAANGNNSILGNRKRIVLLPPGIYNMENINFPYEYIHLRGASMPRQNESGDSIFGGTLLVGGRLHLNGKYAPTIEDLGVDVSGVSPRDAIASGGSGSGSQHITIRNVLLKGVGERHGIVVTSGGEAYIEGVEIESFDHGVALRGSDNILSKFRMIDCKKSSVIGKSIVSGDIRKCKGNIINDGYCLATSLGTGAGIVFDANDIGSETYGNTVSNVYMDRVSYGIRMVGDGDVYGNKVSDIYMDRPNQAGVYLEGNADNNSFVNISVIDVNGTPFVNEGTGRNNDINNSYYGNPSNAKDTIGEFRNYTVHEIL